MYNNKETSTEILEHYGDILYEKGEHTKALEYWNKAKEKHNRLGKQCQLVNNGSFELQAAEISLYQGKKTLALQIVRQLKNVSWLKGRNHRLQGGLKIR